MSCVNYRLNMRMGIKVLRDEPDDLVNLENWRGGSHCGTLHCAAGLFCTEPFFNKQGLVAIGSMGTPMLVSEVRDGLRNIVTGCPFEALDRLFGALAFDRYFNKRGCAIYDTDRINDLYDKYGRSPADKELAIARLQDGLTMPWEKIRLSGDPLEEPVWNAL